MSIERGHNPQVWMAPAVKISDL